MLEEELDTEVDMLDDELEEDTLTKKWHNYIKKNHRERKNKPPSSSETTT